MSRSFWFHILLIVVVKLAVPLGGLGLALITSDERVTPDAIVALVNEERGEAGVRMLARDRALDRAAAWKLDHMAAAGYFAHVSPNGRQPWDFIRDAGYSYRVAGENLARGFTDPDALVSAWMRSPSHRANILGAGYRDIGIAVRRVTISGRSSLVVVQMFGGRGRPATAPLVPRTGSQRVSTNAAIASVDVSAVAGATVGASWVLSNVLAAYFAGLIVLTTLTAAVRRSWRPAVPPLAGTTALLVAVVSLPALPVALPLIF